MIVWSGNILHLHARKLRIVLLAPQNPATCSVVACLKLRNPSKFDIKTKAARTAIQAWLKSKVVGGSVDFG